MRINNPNKFNHDELADGRNMIENIKHHLFSGNANQDIVDVAVFLFRNYQFVELCLPLAVYYYHKDRLATAMTFIDEGKAMLQNNF